jgi:hypothetical protein
LTAAAVGTEGAATDTAGKDDDMADEDLPYRVQPDRPAKPPVETRDETVARVVGPVEAVSVDRGGSSDPSTRRGFQRLLTRRFFTAAGAGGLVGVALGLALYFLPGPREEGRGLGAEGGNWANAVGYAVVMGVALAIVAAVLSSYFILAREDGRIEREVEEQTGHQPEGPGRPNRPHEDPEPR